MRARALRDVAAVSIFRPLSSPPVKCTGRQMEEGGALGLGREGPVSESLCCVVVSHRGLGAAHGMDVSPCAQSSCVYYIRHSVLVV